MTEATGDYAATPLSTGALRQYKRKVIRQIELTANEHQHKALGTPDPAREMRFRFNADSAKAILNGTATTEETVMMQTQLDANIYAQNPLIAHKTLMEFAQLISDLHALMLIASGVVEKVLIMGRADVRVATTKAEIDEAMIKFNEMVVTETAIITGKLYAIYAKG